MRRCLACLAALAVLLSMATPALGAPDEPYGAVPIAQPTQELILREWKTMPQKMLRDAAALKVCREDKARCSAASLSLIGLIDRVKGLSLHAKFLAVEAAVNHMVSYVTDLEQWGPVDGKKEAEVWTSALEVAASGKGDCDDYANLKFFVLWQSGVPLSRMRFVILDYVSDESHELHFVLAAKGLKVWLLLDSMPLKPAMESRVVSVLEPYNLQGPALVAAAEPKAR